MLKPCPKLKQGQHGHLLPCFLHSLHFLYPTAVLYFSIKKSNTKIPNCFLWKTFVECSWLRCSIFPIDVVVAWGMGGRTGAFSLVWAGLFYCFASKKTQRGDWYHLPAIKIIAANIDWILTVCWGIHQMLYKDYFFKSSGEHHDVEPIIIFIFNMRKMRLRWVKIKFT